MFIFGEKLKFILLDMKMRTILLLFVLLDIAVINSKENCFHFKNSYLHGASTICCYAQDMMGLIWMGTDTGLYSYDGYHAVSHSSRSQASNVRIHCMTVVGNYLYMGCENGLLIFNITQNRFLDVESKGPNDIRAITQKGTKLLLGSANGLIEYDQLDGSFKTLCLPNQAIYSVLQTPDGLFLGTIHGLYEVCGKGVKLIPILRGNQPLINALIRDSVHHCYWIGVEGGLYQSDLETFAPITKLKGNSVKALCLNQDSDLMIGTDNGLYIYHDKKTLQKVIHNYHEVGSLTNNIIWSLYRDRSENIWIGTDNGFSLLPHRSAITYTPISDVITNGKGNCLHDILLDRQGTMWMGGTNGLLKYKYTNKTYKDVSWFRQDSYKTPLSHNRVRKIYQDVDGDIWVATDHGINWFNREKGVFRNFIVTDSTGHYSCNWAYDILLDAKGRIWVAAYMGGIFVIDKQRLLRSDGTSIADKHIDSGKGGLANIHVGQLAFDIEGNVMAMTYGKGIDCINPITFKVTHTLTKKKISFMFSDSKGRIWGGYNGGVVLFLTGLSKPRIIAFNDGLISSQISSIAEIDGKIWIFSGRVCRILNSKGQLTHIQLPSSDIRSSYYEISSQRLYLGVNDGFWILFPKSIISTQSDKRLQLTSLMVNGREYRDQNNNVGFSSRVNLSHEKSDIAFRFTDIPYDYAPSPMYVYQLEGVDKAWKYCDFSQGEIAYHALHPGSYRFLIRNIDHSSDDTTIKSIDLTIFPPWYLSLWLKLIYMIILMIFIYWVMNFYATKKSLKQERLARKRMMEQSQARSDFFSHLSRKLKIPLAHIFSPVYRLLASNKTQNELLEEICEGATELNLFIYKSLDLGGEHSVEKVVPEISTIDVVSYFRYLVSDLNKKNDFNLCLVEKIVSFDLDVDIVRWDIIFRSSLEFVFCHARVASTIKIILDNNLEDKIINICIVNETMQLSEAEQRRMFLKYNIQNVAEQMATPDLYLVREYVNMSKGNILFEEIAKEGQSLKLSFPFTRKKNNRNQILNNPTDKLFAEILTVIEAHISDTDFNVTRLQVLLGVGNKMLYRKIKQITGMSPVEYIRNIRLKKARLLLNEGKFTVSEVMYMVGFSNSGYFSRCFHQAFGMSPVEYRNRK